MGNPSGRLAGRLRQRAPVRITAGLVRISSPRLLRLPHEATISHLPTDTLLALNLFTLLMAGEELATKLAKRLKNICETTDSCALATETFSAPPAPEVPKKVVPNPYVAADDSVSIDDLITKTLKRNECTEENNNVNSTNHTENITTDAHMIFLASKDGAPASGLPPKKTLAELLAKDNADSAANQREPPPKTTIGELVERDRRPLSPTVTCQRPTVTIERSQKKPLEQRKKSTDNDDSELQEKLAAQRMKKCYDASTESASVAVSTSSPGDAMISSDSTENQSTQAVSESSTSEIKTVTEDAEMMNKGSSTSEESVRKHGDGREDQSKSVVSEEETSCKPKQPECVSVPVAPPEETVKKSGEISNPEDNLKDIPFPKQAEDTELKRLMAEELKKCKTKVEEMLVLKDIESRKDDRPFSPSKELMAMIQRENGIRSPPPVPPPKPQTPSHSRPQSPAIKKLSMSGGVVIDEKKLCNGRQSNSAKSIQKQSFSQDSGDELATLLERRTKILNGESVPDMITKKIFFTDTFKRFDDDADGFIDFDELKRMMEKLGEAQTHIALKEIIRKVDEDQDGKISLREFFLIFRLAAQNQLGCSEVFQKLADSVDVSKEGVLGAASFFQAKIEEQTKLSRFEQEIKEEHEERKRLEEEKKARREKFLQHKSLFQ
ncbi:hypothetical protein KIN20_012376 [Parelaphostrongylus tenuis]|uniref:EF-hand domain-containing protein n=1 Tax=Parelaphostrongylus tenuis TaxID=148309 RepID=A0AAD5QMS0_PARTN|nr:hypothetical protein KIN20_012376 [Parelaphostrongylus tenuis]